jgi:DNA repair exonuclease SbcCD ATPase subunit
VLKTALDKQSSELQSLTKKRDSLQADITKLESTVTDYKSKVDEYKEKWKELKQKKSDLDQYVGTKGPMLEAAVKDKKPRILHCITSVDQWIAQWAQHAETRKKEAEQAKQRAEAATERATKAQEKYDALQASAATIGSVLDDLKNRQKAIETEEEGNHKLKTARMYFLFLDLVKMLSGVTIGKPEDFERELCSAWTELNQAKSAEREAMAAATAAEAAAQEAAAKRDLYKSKRQEKVFACIDKLCGNDPTPPPQPGYGTPAAP